MQCIPTCAVMDTTDPELVSAKAHLTAYFTAAKLLARPDPVSAAAQPTANPIYLCSIPRRQENGAISYVHIFRPNRPAPPADFIYLPASPRWWPANCHSLQPLRRTQQRATLELVS